MNKRLSPAEKQALLEAETLAQRLEMLHKLWEMKLAGRGRDTDTTLQ